MSTLKTDEVSSTVNFPYNAKVNGCQFLQREFYSTATLPTPINIGATWWNSTTSTMYVYFNGQWNALDQV